MTPSFDSYLMVDWSGAKRPCTGPDSIWLHVLARRNGRLERLALDNPPTRHTATGLLRSWLHHLVSEKRRVLVGFDFPLGYPRGTAQRLGLGGTPWRALWDRLADMMRDGANNANNRFAVADELNRELSDEAFPFWGCPVSADGTLGFDHLQATRLRMHLPSDLPSHRLVEQRMPSAQPVWKLYGTGSVGGQALTGIPRVRSLRDDPDLAKVTRIWPFETGFALSEARVVITEIYPSLIACPPLDSYPKDAAQVVAIAEHYARLDEAGALDACFAGGKDMAALERRDAAREEGWVLGVSEPLVRVLEPPTEPAYLRDPQAIYARSWEMVRDSIDLDSIDPQLHDVAIRLVHTAGDPTVIDGLAASPDAVARAKAALARGAPILVDAEMVAAGITTHPPGGVICTLNHDAVPELAERRKTTRSAAAVDFWQPHLEGAVVAIGNAPTALYRLLELIQAGVSKPAVVIGFPVGFVGAAESKDALMAQSTVPWIALGGRRGGSALAAAAVNALLQAGSEEFVAPNQATAG
jgi:precorrin-8X/cobalt-precorrin-8 methylmutase